MNDQIQASIAYIACRLISGKKIAILYDAAASREIDVTAVIGEEFITDFEERHRDYIPGYASDCTYRFTSGAGPMFEIFINEKTFVAHIRGTAAYFIGNVRGDSVYLYDHCASRHLRYRIVGYLEKKSKAAT